MSAPQVSVLFVCLGNICRSPTAEGVFRKQVADAGLLARVLVDSAGILSSTHGAPPDPRTVEAARRRGYELSELRARPLRADDFRRFDLVLGMDRDNLEDMLARCPESHAAKVRLFLSFTERPDREVPDPFLGEDQDFETVLDLVEHGGLALLRHLRGQLP
jgi:protein-tyrosine phosphatase